MYKTKNMKLKIVGFNKDNQEVELNNVITMIDGYDFGDRLMEGVMYNVSLNQDKTDINIEINEKYKDYFKMFNKNYWYKLAKNDVISQLDEFGVCDSVKINSKDAQKLEIDNDVAIIDKNFEKTPDRDIKIAKTNLNS